MTTDAEGQKVAAMRAADPAVDRTGASALARLSPLVLVAVAGPWILQWAIVESVARLAPAYEPLVTGDLAEWFLYPVVTGSITLAGLYAYLDPETRRALFLFRRPSRRELAELAAAVPAGIVLQIAASFVIILALGIEPGPRASPALTVGYVVRFALVAAVFAPIVEEVLFRGLLLGYLIERGVPTLAAAGVVVAAFGAVHQYGGIVHVGMAAAWATVPIALRLRHDNLVTPVLAHAITNLIAGLVILPSL